MSSVVLIVEDQRELAEELRAFVERWDLAAEVVATIDAALAVVESRCVCAVLLDPMTASAGHAALIYEGGEVPIVLIPVALRVTSAFRIERFLVAPESLERIVRRHCQPERAA